MLKEVNSYITSEIISSIEIINYVYYYILYKTKKWKDTIMGKIEEVRSDMVNAMKAGNKDTKETLSMLLAALKNKAIDKRADLTEEEETQVILKEIKQTKETLELTPADRTEIIEECHKRLAVLETYAPKMMSAEEIKEIVSSVLSELNIASPTGKDKGNIMKALMPKVKGKADGKLVNEIVGSFM